MGKILEMSAEVEVNVSALFGAGQKPQNTTDTTDNKED